MERASRRFWNPLNAEFRLGKAGAKGERKVHRRVSCPCETCLAQMQYSTWQSVGKGLKLHGGFWGPGGTCFAQVLKPSKRRISTWWNVLRAGFEAIKGRGKGERCTGGFRVLVKSAWRRCGNHLNAIFDLAKRCGKGLKLHGGFWGPGGTCFAQVLKPSKCSISTWQGRGKEWWQSAGKGLKLRGRVWGPGGTCFAQVLKPSKM